MARLKTGPTLKFDKWGKRYDKPVDGNKFWKLADNITVWIWKTHIKLIHNPLKSLTCWTARKAEGLKNKEV